jgi:hypothetical protein
VVVVASANAKEIMDAEVADEDEAGEAGEAGEAAKTMTTTII